MDKLQNRIRKLKNPSVLVLRSPRPQLPQHLVQEEGETSAACLRFYTELLTALKDTIPAVRLDMGGFSLCMSDGLQLLCQIAKQASDLGYYVILDVPQLLSAEAAEDAAEALMDGNCPIYADGYVVGSWIGSDALRPFVKRLKETGKDLFPVVRTANRSAGELQDLLSGTRLVHLAAADTAGRLGEPLSARCGYNKVGILASATSSDGLRNLRQKHPTVFFLLDGYDYPNANAKYCSYAFDKLGHGAAACAGNSILAAWQEAGSDGDDYLVHAVDAAERMKRNLTRYITIL